MSTPDQHDSPDAVRLVIPDARWKEGCVELVREFQAEGMYGDTHIQLIDDHVDGWPEI